MASIVPKRGHLAHPDSLGDQSYSSGNALAEGEPPTKPYVTIEESVSSTHGPNTEHSIATQQVVGQSRDTTRHVEPSTTRSHHNSMRRPEFEPPKTNPPDSASATHGERGTLHQEGSVNLRPTSSTKPKIEIQHQQDSQLNVPVPSADDLARSMQTLNMSITAEDLQSLSKAQSGSHQYATIPSTATSQDGMSSAQSPPTTEMASAGHPPQLTYNPIQHDSHPPTQQISDTTHSMSLQQAKSMSRAPTGPNPQANPNTVTRQATNPYSQSQALATQRGQTHGSVPRGTFAQVVSSRPQRPGSGTSSKSQGDLRRDQQRSGSSHLSGGGSHHKD